MKGLKKAVKKITFPNGATLLYQKAKTKSYHGTAIVAGFARGSKQEKIAGSMHFLEHQLFNGSENFSKEDLAKLKKIAYVNGSTNPMSIRVIGEFSNKLTSSALPILSDILLNPKLTEENIETEKGVVHEELNKSLNNTKNNLNALHETLFDDNYDSIYDTIGTHESIDQITKKDLEELIDKNFRAEYFVISVCSSLPLFKIKRMVKKYFLPKLKPAEKVEENTISHEYVKKGNAMRVYTDDRERVECKISFLCDLGLLNCRNIAGINNFYRSLEKDGKLIFDDLRDHGLVYSESESSDSMEKTSCFLVTFLTSKEKLLNVLKIIGEHIHYAFNNPLSSEKIEEIKSQEKYRQDVHILRENPVQKARDDFWAYCGNIGSYDINWVKLQKKLTSEDVSEFVHAFFNEDVRMQVSIRGNLTEEDVLTYDQIREILVGGLKKE